ncbi:MAG: cupin-like domain-containing protein [Paracoccaceae bacterium]
MNVSYPAENFLTPQATVEGFIALLQGGFENPEKRSGTVRVTVPEHPELSFRARFQDRLVVDRPDASFDADTHMVFPIKTLEKMFLEFEFLDWRSPEILGTMKITGDLGLAFVMGLSCLRPSNWTQARFRNAETLHRQKGYRDLTELERLYRPSQMQLLEAMEESRPVIITGIEPEPPRKDWTLDRLLDRYADVVVCVRSEDDFLTLRDFVEDMRKFDENPDLIMSEGLFKPYTEGSALPKEMWDDFGSVFFDRENFIPPQFWFGSVRTDIPATHLHRDPLTGFLFQVMGRKRLDLYSADQAENLYPLKAYNNYQRCWFKPESPDYEIYPKAIAAKCISVELHPGELLVQPAGWFHQVYALDNPTLSVSYFWRY